MKQPRVLMDRTQWEPHVLEAVREAFPACRPLKAWQDDTLFVMVYCMDKQGQLHHTGVAFRQNEMWDNDNIRHKENFIRRKVRIMKMQLEHKGVHYQHCTPLTFEMYKAVKNGKKEK